LPAVMHACPAWECTRLTRCHAVAGNRPDRRPPGTTRRAAVLVDLRLRPEARHRRRARLMSALARRQSPALGAPLAVGSQVVAARRAQVRLDPTLATDAMADRQAKPQ